MTRVRFRHLVTGMRVGRFSMDLVCHVVHSHSATNQF
jgi:hypothetical protein